MSVDYKAKLVIGVPIDVKYQDIINEATNYEYEEWFHYGNYYREDVDTVILGKCIMKVDAGLFKQLPDFSLEEFDSIAETIFNILEKSDYPDPYKAYQNVIDYMICEVS
jgi:hypothetical protein